MHHLTTFSDLFHLKCWTYCVCSFYFYRWTQIFYGREDTESDSEASRAPSYDPGSHYDHGMFSWIFAVFRIKYKFCFDIKFIRNAYNLLICWKRWPDSFKMWRRRRPVSIVPAALDHSDVNYYLGQSRCRVTHQHSRRLERRWEAVWPHNNQ